MYTHICHGTIFDRCTRNNVNKGSVFIVCRVATASLSSYRKEYCHLKSSYFELMLEINILYERVTYSIVSYINIYSSVDKISRTCF